MITNEVLSVIMQCQFVVIKINVDSYNTMSRRMLCSYNTIIQTIIQTKYMYYYSYSCCMPTDSSHQSMHLRECGHIVKCCETIRGICGRHTYNSHSVNKEYLFTTSILY